MKMNEKEIRECIMSGRRMMHMPERVEDYVTDQYADVKQPPLFKEPVSDRRISLPLDFDSLEMDRDLCSIINKRVSSRVYTEEAVSLLQISWMLWCTQGVKSIRGKAYAALRTVPSGGARHAYETYLCINNCRDLDAGYYHYLPQHHALELIREADDLASFIDESSEGQKWTVKASVVFYWSFVPYRAEWRYGMYAHRVALIDAGYISQNLYLACTAMHLGTCAIGAISEDICNAKFNLDGEEEFIMLMQTVGTVSPSDSQKEKDFYAFVLENDW